MLTATFIFVDNDTYTCEIPASDAAVLERQFASRRGARVDVDGTRTKLYNPPGYDLQVIVIDLETEVTPGY